MKCCCYFTEPPEPPTDVTLSVASSNSLFVRFSESDQPNGAAVTRYKGKYHVFSFIINNNYY